MGSDDHQIDGQVPLGLLAAIVDSSDDAIYTKSPDATITSWNAGAERLYGYTGEEAVGRPVSMLIPEDHHGEDIVMLARILGGEPVRHFETVRRTKAGELVDVSLSISPVRDARGEIVGASVIARDISERRRVENARSLLAAIVESTDDAVYTKTAGGVISSWNSAARRLYGYAPEEAIGRPVSMLIPAHRAGEDTVILGRILAGERIDHFETERRRKDGTLVAVAVTASPIRDRAGTVRGASIVARDISPRIRAEAERARYISALEDYNTIIAHDLTEPTRTIEGFAQYVEHHSASALDERSREALGHIRRSAQRMAELIEGLRQYAEVNSAVLHEQPVALDDVVRDTVASLDLRLGEEGADVRVAQLPEVAGDPVLLGQLFQNLISNAVKFHGDEPPVVEVTAEREPDGWVVSVSDNGIGLKPRDADQVFGMYQRLHTREAYDGTGVGLAVARKIVERHGGRIWFTARPEGGTSFCVSLPAAASPAPAAPAT